VITLAPIPFYGHLEDKKFETKASQQLIEIYKNYYPTIGYQEPWIGYFVLRDDVVVGSCGFTGPPRDGAVEIAYWTFEGFERQGIASMACKLLVNIASNYSPHLLITAKTQPEENASTRILRKNGFRFDKVVVDHEIGDAWEWVIDDKNPKEAICVD
jgi:[ribosomal protein S5]-alanine N-acetyltransferase